MKNKFKDTFYIIMPEISAEFKNGVYTTRPATMEEKRTRREKAIKEKEDELHDLKSMPIL